LPVFEAMTLDSRLRGMIQAGASTSELRQCAISGGMIPLAKSAERLASTGATDLAEVGRVIGTDD
jgi:type II secretory ATPase GspE/PulE/Tfp pilus assembly ATPase PilB-like protein